MHAAAILFPTAPRAVKAVPVKLARRMSAEQAFCRIAQQCLDQIAANQAGVRAHDMESLHQMRVGLRRLRAALSMFRDLLVLPASMQVELDWLVDVLGPPRDWDVLIAATLPQLGHALPTVEQAAKETALCLHEEAAGALASARHARLMRALGHWVDERGWRTALTPGRKARLKMPVKDLASAIFGRDQQRLRKRGRKLKQGSAEQRHRMRIAAKRTRYATEFFASLYPARQVRPYVKALAGLQDALGRLNDAAVADRLLAELGERTGDTAADAAYARALLASRAERSLGNVRRRWKTFRPLHPPG